MGNYINRAPTAALLLGLITCSVQAQIRVNDPGRVPESYGALKDIANVLTENADVQVRIIGHTDSDGDDTLYGNRRGGGNRNQPDPIPVPKVRLTTDGWSL